MTIGGQVRYIVVFVSSLWLASLVSSRVMLFHRELVTAQQHYEDDLFTLQTVCANNDIRAHLGRNGHICDKAAIAVKILPWQSALHVVVKNTHLCGDTPCTAVVHDATSTMSSLIFTIVCACVSPWVFVWIFNRIFHKVDHFRARCHVKRHEDGNWDSVLPLRAHSIKDE